MNFASLPDRRADLDPNGPAVSDGMRALTNAGLLERVRAARRHLQELGFGAGDVVALMLRNRVEFVVLLFACWRLGATVTPVNPSLTDAEVVRQCKASGARLLVVEDGVSAPDEVATMAVGNLYAKGPGWDAPPSVDPSALALLIFTSGTTGVPKGVMLDHANLDAMAEMGRQALGIGPADRCLLILPLFHVNGIVVSVLMSLLAGASVVIAERFDPHTFFELIEAERPTFFSAVPTIYTMLSALPDEVAPDTSSLRFGICGAAPASAELLARFEARYGFPLIEGYGLSEGTCASTINPVAGPRRAGTVGIAFPGQQIRIIDANGADVATGVDGEVIIAGPNVMRGYLGRADETARVIVDGWLHAGDVGHLDADGYLTLVGRSKDMIIRGGENIYPKEIEDVLTSDPAVLDAAVIGVSDDKWGETVAAYVQPGPGRTINPEALHVLCARKLAGYKRPTSITVMDAIPKNAVGKTDKAPLRTAHLKDIRMTSLHDPLTLPCGQVLPNRIMKAALSEGLGDKQNSPDHRLERLYTSWSQGGYGLIVTGNVMVDRTQLGEPGNVVIEDERNLDALSRWAKATKDAGVPIWVQLNHPGRQSNPLALGHTPVAPSPVALNFPGAATPRELTSAEIEDIIERFATAAKVCETAGFDGVQIHAAHGYLVAQFLSPLSNQRDDEWGGDPQRRMRFVLEVVRRIRARVSPGFAVGIKLNSADFQRGGFTEDESRAVVVALASEGVDLIEVSGGSYEQPAMMGTAADSTRAREAYFLEYARTVRSLAGDIPLAVTGGFRSRAAMHDAVLAGECDVIGLGRPTATTTDAADVILAGRAETLATHQLRTGMRRVLGRFVDIKSLDGILELSWHADQLHRVGAGLKPDLNRGRIATMLAMLRRNGTTSIGRKRGL